jgi:hypothetical protein
MAHLARVELKGSLSHTKGDRVFKKGVPQHITDPDEIRYYSSMSSFNVVLLEVSKPKSIVGSRTSKTESKAEPEAEPKASPKNALPKKVPPKKPMKRKKG